MRRLPFTAAVSVLALMAMPGFAAPAQAPQAGSQATSTGTDAPAPFSLDDALHHAQALRAQGNFADATRALGQLMLVAPDDPRVVGEYGKALAQQGRPQDAVAFLKRAVELKATDWTFYSAMGVAYDQMDDHKSAASAYEHALALKPGEPTVLNNYAVSRMLAGDLDGAQRMLSQASSAGGSYPKIANNLDTLSHMKSGNPAATAVAAAPPPKSAAVASAAPAQTTSVAASAPSKQTAVAQAPAPTQAKITTASLPAPTGARTADAAPASLVASQTPAKAQPATVVMQQVPVDPLAGPVSPPAPRKLTNHPGAKTRLAKASPKAATPVLRTAGD